MMILDRVQNLVRFFTWELIAENYAAAPLAVT